MDSKPIFSVFVIGVFVFLITIPGSAQVFETRPPEREYVVGIGDQLDIQVWRSPDFSRKVVVRSDGRITMPLLGDIQAAGLRVSTLRERLEELLLKYLKQPQVTIIVGSTNVMQITLSGSISQVANPPRGTTLRQVLREIFPTLQQIQPPPNLAAMKVIGVDGEFLINGEDLVTGRSLQGNIRLEWGDEIFIPQSAPPTPVPLDIPRVTPVRVQIAVLTPAQLEELIRQYPENEDLLRALAVQSDEGMYMITMTEISEDQRQALGEPLFRELEQYIRRLGERPYFTDISLAGININLAVEGTLEAFLAVPNSNPEQPPLIERFYEGDLVLQGTTAAEDIVLETIDDEREHVILRQGEIRQALPLSQAFSNAKLSGILTLGRTRKAFFSDLTPIVTSNRPTKRSFQKSEEIEKGVLLADISERWVLLQKEDNFQLVFLRDSLNRVPPTPTPAPVPQEIAQLPQEEAGLIPQIPGLPQMPSGAIKEALPPPLQALDTLTQILFATPLF